MKVRHLRHRARPAPRAEPQPPLRCIRCGRRIKVALHGLGPVCALRAGYVPPAKAAKAARRAAERTRLRTRAKAIHQPDLFDSMEESA